METWLHTIATHIATERQKNLRPWDAPQWFNLDTEIAEILLAGESGLLDEKEQAKRNESLEVE